MLATVLLLFHIAAALGGPVPDLWAFTCAAVTCMEGFECRIVYNPANKVTRPSCEDPSDIDENANDKRCGGSSMLLLELVEGGKKRQLKVYQCKQDCPSPGLVCRNNVCCTKEVSSAEKCGSCPMLGDVGICVVDCACDQDCKGAQKCCPTGCSGSFSCTDPVKTVSCLTVNCTKGYVCKDTSDSPECVPIQRPGECPLYECARPPEPRHCKDSCKVDSDCQGNDKCCWGCNGCHSCVRNSFRSCRDIRCPADQACVMQQVQCITTPCDPVPMCVDIAPNQGKCPVIPNGGASRCAITCEYDSQCRPFQKCCKNACGGTACTEPEPELTCSTMLCKHGTCRMVLNRNTGLVSPQCLEDLPNGSNNKVCISGPPLLVQNNNGPVTVSFCGRGPQRVDCPDGYFCKIAPDDSYALCCPEVCSLPKVVGICMALIPSFYYDYNSHSCRSFNYGGCGGNANRFPTKRECNRACGFIKCPQIPETECVTTWNQCTTWGTRPKVCPAGQTCCKTPCGLRCLVP